MTAIQRIAMECGSLLPLSAAGGLLRHKKAGASLQLSKSASKLSKTAKDAVESPGKRPIPLWFHLALAGTVLLFFIWYVAVELHQNGILGFPLDDPWIHLTFARNLARGMGFAYNHGEPVQGSTAPLWTLILAFFHLFTRNATAMVWITKLLDAFFLWVAAVFASRLTAHLATNQWAGLAAGLAVATLCHFDWAMVSGMEVTLSVALVLAGLYYYATRPRGRKAYLSWALFALAVYTRPETLMVAAFLIIDLAIRRFAFRQKVIFWRGLGLWLLVLVPYFALNLTLVHSLFPQTYLAKVGRTSLFSALATGDNRQIALLLGKAPWVYFSGFVSHLWRGSPVLVLLAIPGIIVSVTATIRRKGTTGFLIPFIALGYAPILGMTAPFGAPAFQNGRYLGAPVGVVVLLGVLGGDWLLKRIRRRTGRLAAEGVLAALALFNVVSTGLATTRNTALAESSINRMQVVVGKWLAENTPASAVIACNDVGAIGYFANRRILDLLGLVTPGALAYRRKQPAGNESQDDLGYIQAVKPDYLAIFPSWFRDLQGAKFIQPVYAVDIKDNYASQYDFEPQLRTFAGILVTGLDLEPVQSTTVIFKCDWTQGHS